MMKTVGVSVLTVFTVVLCMSCTELPKQLEFEEGEIAMEPNIAPASIPMEWGKLVSVTSQPDVMHVYQLWFQDEAGTIRIALYNRNRNMLLNDAMVIPRTNGGEDHE